MVRCTGCNASWKSRQALGGRRWRQMVSPRGKGERVADQFLDQQGHEQFPVEPGLGALVIPFGQRPPLRQGLEALENQFHLPAQAVPPQDPLGGKGCGRRCREHDDVLGRQRTIKFPFA